MEYYDESLLLALATSVGTPVKVDVRTLEASRGKFARVCIEIDLDKPVVGKVWFRDYWYHIEYEGLHLLCKNCGIYGHVARKCPSSSVGTGTHKKETGDVNLADGSTATASSQPQPNLNTSMTSINGGVESAEESLYGDWLVVNRKKNQGRKTRAKLQEEKEVNQNKSSKNVKGGMFAQLADAGEIEFSGTPLHAMGTKFHPGESSNIPKVWTKSNKRARGIGQKGKETTMPNKPKLGLPFKPLLIKDNMGRTGPVTNPFIVPHNSLKQHEGNRESVVLMIETPTKHTDSAHLKPPDPNEANRAGISNNEDASEGIDGMLLETTQLEQ
jgi:hypothetical protein